jgi:alkylation response protein AidB-like acyl-CoA dehydrogenase
MHEPAIVAPLADPTDGGISLFLERYSRTLKRLFTVRSDTEDPAQARGLSPKLVREVWSAGPLHVAIPQEYGGRGTEIRDFLQVLAASSYESLPLSLVMGINGGLFLQPVAKYGSEELKREVFPRFTEQNNLGGLMITEPGFGSDALRMQTYYEEDGDGYRIRGVKHWAGLTGRADFWIIAARRRESSGQLGRDVEFFVCDQHQPEQRIEAVELYDNLGLYMIPYGRNVVDVRVPRSHRLVPESSGIRMMLDMLYRSRAQFPGMGLGFLKRILDEAWNHCHERNVGGRSLFTYDQVKERLARLQASVTACSAMCAYSSEHAGVDKALWKDGVAPNAIKAVVTDLMHDAGHSLLQLVGAKGYRLDHVAGRAILDSRPFQIFEGSNDILYQQISEAVLKQMRKVRESNLYRYLSEYELTARASERFRDLLNVEIDAEMPQRKMVDLGRALGRIISMEFTLELGERGFRGDLIAGGLTVLRQDVENLLSSYRSSQVAGLVEDYVVGSAWPDFLQPEGA